MKLFKKIAITLALIALMLTLMPVVHAQKLQDPLALNSGDANVSPIAVLAGRIIRVMLGFVGSISLVMFIYGGFIMITSAGNMEKVKKAKDTMVWAVIGVFLSLTSYAIINYVITKLAQRASSS